ncbi:toxin-antitoxin system YwqK family antitoxin [Pseudomonadota bacterium]
MEKEDKSYTIYNIYGSVETEAVYSREKAFGILKIYDGDEDEGNQRGMEKFIYKEDNKTIEVKQIYDFDKETNPELKLKKTEKYFYEKDGKTLDKKEIYDEEGNLKKVEKYFYEKGQKYIYDENGKLIKKRFYTRSKILKKEQIFDENGQLIEEGFYGIDGKTLLERQTFTYHKNEKLEKKKVLRGKDGSLRKEQIFDENGQLIEEGFYGINGKTIKIKQIYESGTKRSAKFYDEGVIRIYNDEGKVISTTSTIKLDNKSIKAAEQRFEIGKRELSLNTKKELFLDENQKNQYLSFLKGDKKYSILDITMLENIYSVHAMLLVRQKNKNGKDILFLFDSNGIRESTGETIVFNTFDTPLKIFEKALCRNGEKLIYLQHGTQCASKCASNARLFKNLVCECASITPCPDLSNINDVITIYTNEKGSFSKEEEEILRKNPRMAEIVGRHIEEGVEDHIIHQYFGEKCRLVSHYLHNLKIEAAKLVFPKPKSVNKIDGRGV